MYFFTLAPEAMMNLIKASRPPVTHDFHMFVRHRVATLSCTLDGSMKSRRLRLKCGLASPPPPPDPQSPRLHSRPKLLLFLTCSRDPWCIVARPRGV